MDVPACISRIARHISCVLSRCFIPPLGLEVLEESHRPPHLLRQQLRLLRPARLESVTPEPMDPHRCRQPVRTARKHQWYLLTLLEVLFDSTLASRIYEFQILPYPRRELLTVPQHLLLCQHRKGLDILFLQFPELFILV